MRHPPPRPEGPAFGLCMMNIFVLDNNIERCARYHCDQHVVKMILEGAQILCTALTINGHTTPYKSAHQNHPCVLWTAESYDNFIWLHSLTFALNREYRYRYERKADHKSIAVIESLSGMSYENHGLTPFVQAMPEQYRNTANPVAAYRDYYRGEKLRFARWTKRQPPRWING